MTEEQKIKLERTAHLKLIADLIILDLIDISAEEGLSKRAPLERRMMKKYSLSPREVMYCFRLMEREHSDELALMHYRSFSRWNHIPKFPTDTRFYRKNP